MGFKANFDSNKPSPAVQAQIDAAPGAVKTAAALENLKAVAPGVMTASELARKQAAQAAAKSEYAPEPSAPAAPAKIDPATVSKADMVAAMQNMIAHMKAAERRIKSLEERVERSEKKAAQWEEAFDEVSMAAYNQARQIAALRTKFGKLTETDFDD
ncbi:hypothetical protein [Massilia sp. NP310]|uniref:hypothetical protein n=1 Tax=Massilia sp. NP310 TaxID=2861282 RepID=UPI001C62D38D|nr:hypothetical protein [Massilia sp. NP310]QYG04024.1 hypothetical protein KY496_11900 [Massilia sp. NP310]